ncbi:MAG: hypothetical protein U0414_11410 [Polyangiaceae bacterium]
MTSHRWGFLARRGRGARVAGSACAVALLGLTALAAGACDGFTGTTSSAAGGASGSSSSESTLSAMTTVSSTSTVSSTDASSSSGMPDPCDVTEGALIPESCGVFVAPGATGVGTQSSPFGSIATALAVATPAGKPVYVCSGQFDETIQLVEGTSLFGGIDCTSGYRWVGKPTAADRTLVSPASGVPLVVTPDPMASTVARVFGFTFHAPPGVAASDSSIAAIVEGAPTRFEQSRFEASAAKDGTDAVQNAAPPVAGGAGNAGHATLNGTCSPAETTFFLGGAAKSNPSCPSSIGGEGGQGGTGLGSDGLPGSNGAPLDAMHPALGIGGSGQACGMICPPCKPGAQGVPGGDGGDGSAGAGAGSIVGTTYVGVNGGAGDPGGIGGGGGGGGGAHSVDGCRADSGGSGGAGGCGGAGGAGGTFGGSSIALVVVGTANVTFVGCTAASAQAGRGGDGAPGIAGAPGGAGGNGGNHLIAGAFATDACAGGQGGAGGDGGNGGGGSGGHSVGLVSVNTMCDATGLSFDPVSPSFAGAAGVGAGINNDGTPGQAVETLSLP